MSIEYNQIKNVTKFLEAFQLISKQKKEKEFTKTIE